MNFKLWLEDLTKRSNIATTVLGDIVKKMQDHNRVVHQLLANQEAIRQGARNFNNSHDEEVLRLDQGWKELAALNQQLQASQIQDRELMLFIRELSIALNEGRELSIALRQRHLDEETFDMIHMNYQKLIRLESEAISFLEKHNPNFSRSFSRVQPQREIPGLGWRRKQDAPERVI
jgi:hypothetical protein